MTANGAPLADSSEEEEGEEDPEAEEESEDTRTSHPKPLLKHELLRKRDLSPSSTWDQSDGQINSACTAHKRTMVRTLSVAPAHDLYTSDRKP